MDSLVRFLVDHRHALSFISAGWMIAVLSASLVYRLLKREGLSMKPQGEVLFHDRFGSGNSHRNFLTKWGGARNCLLVTVTDRELLVRPWFPFNLFFLAELYDLEHRIPIAQIASIHERRNWLGHMFLDIEFGSSATGNRLITLDLRRKEDFLEALRKAGVKLPLNSFSDSNAS